MSDEDRVDKQAVVRKDQSNNKNGTRVTPIRVAVFLSKGESNLTTILPENSTSTTSYWPLCSRLGLVFGIMSELVNCQKQRKDKGRRTNEKINK